MMKMKAKEDWARLAQALYPTPEGVETGMRTYKTGFPEAVKAAMNMVLTDQEKQALQMRYGQQPHSFEEVGKALGIGREQARQITARALRKLRHPRLRLAQYFD